MDKLWKRKINSIKYRNIIENYARPLIENEHEEKTTILYDRATPHTTRNTANTLRDINLLLNPAHSPDMSPIELMWEILRYVNARNPKNWQELIDFTLEDCGRIDISVIEASIEIEKWNCTSYIKNGCELITN